MDADAFATFLVVEEGKAETTVAEFLRILRRMERRGLDADAVEDAEAVASFLKYQRPRGRSEYKNNVQVINALMRWKGIERKFPYPRKVRSTPKRFKPWEIERLRAYSHSDPLVMLRGRALVEFALQTGMRRLETALFSDSDLDDVERMIAVDHTVKGGLRRAIPVSEPFLASRGAFMSWMRARPRVSRDPEAVWVAMPNGREPSRMSDTKVGTLFHQIGKACGVRANFQRSRHTCATDLLNRGMPLHHVQFYLGHADLKSTAVYLEADEYDVRGSFGRLRKG